MARKIPALWRLYGARSDGTIRAMAAKFEMDPEATANGLIGAATTRSQAVAAGIPNLPVGNYVAPYMTTLGALLGAGVAELEATVEFGMAAAVSSTTAVQGTQDANTADLTT